MQRTINKIIIFTLAALACLFTSCESLLDIEVGVLWCDDPHFNDSSRAYLGILQGKWDTNSGFDEDVLDMSEVNPGENDCVKFSINASQSDHFTAFVFIDLNDNALYDEGYDGVLGYKYNYSESGAELQISLSAFY